MSLGQILSGPFIESCEEIVPFVFKVFGSTYPADGWTIDDVFVFSRTHPSEGEIWLLNFQEADATQAEGTTTAYAEGICRVRGPGEYITETYEDEECEPETKTEMQCEPP